MFIFATLLVLLAVIVGILGLTGAIIITAAICKFIFLAFISIFALGITLFFAGLAMSMIVWLLLFLLISVFAGILVFKFVTFVF